MSANSELQKEREMYNLLNLVAGDSELEKMMEVLKVKRPILEQEHFQCQVSYILKYAGFKNCRLRNDLRRYFAKAGKNTLTEEETEQLSKFKSQFIYGTNDDNMVDDELMTRNFLGELLEDLDVEGLVTKGVSKEAASRLWDIIANPDVTQEGFYM